MIERGTRERPTDKECLVHSCALAKGEGQIRSVFRKGCSSEHRVPPQNSTKQEFQVQVTF